MNNGSEVAVLQRLVERMRQRIAFVEGSKFWKLRSIVLGVRERFGRPTIDVAPAIPAREYTEVMDSADPYARWLVANEPRTADLARMRELSALVPESLSIAVIVDDARAVNELALTIASVERQVYPRTRLVRTSTHSTEAGVAVRANAALAATDAEIVCFCPENYELAPHATFEIALAFAGDPATVAAYGDRDVVERDGARSNPAFVPDWSPEALLSSLYMGPIVFYRRAAVLGAGGMRDGFGSATHYDLALRVLDADSQVAHRSAVLSHERTLQESATDSGGDGAVRAMRDALVRRDEPGSVVPSPCTGVHVVRFTSVSAGAVDVIVPTRDLAEKLERCLRSVFERNAGLELRVTVIDNGSVEPATARLLAEYAERERGRFRVLRIDEPFNFSRLINAAVRATAAPFLLLLNNDAAFAGDGSIAAMREYASRPAIGAVGARLLYADGSLQHAGVAIGIGTLAGHVYRYWRPEEADATAALSGTWNYSAVTAAALMVRRDAFVAAGGFDEALAVEFNDVDFCLKLRVAGFRNVYLPHVVLRHDESSTRGAIKTPHTFVAREREYFRARWHSDVFADPYYNANLTRLSEDMSPKTA